MKHCKKCDQTKEVDCFSKHRTTADGLQNVCKECINKNSSNYYRKNKEKCSAYTKQWKAANKDKVNLSTSMRRKRIRENTPIWSDPFFLEEAYLLAQLRTSITGFEWHVDHIIPLRGKDVCGLHVIENLQVIPAELNYKKSYYGKTEYTWGSY